MKLKRAFSMFLLGGMALVMAACQLTGSLANAQTPPPLTGKSASRLGAAALTLQQAATFEDASIVPVSIQTAKQVTDAEPIKMHSMSAYGFSNDRSQLAFITGGTPDCPTYCLHRLDLQAWKEAQPLALGEVYGVWFATPVFNRDGTYLALPINHQSDSRGQVQLVDISQAKVLQAASLEGSIFQAAFTPQGSLALYGSRVSADSKTSAMFVALLDGNDLHTLWQQDLTEVRYAAEWAGDLSDPSQGRYLNPAVAFSPDGSRLFVAAADQPLLVTVDFSQHSVNSAVIQPRASLLERLLALGTQVIYAKTLNGISKSGALSQDGRTFYVIGLQTTAVKQADGNYSTDTIPLGLQVIDTTDGALLGSFKTDATDLSLSLDGKSLLLTGWQPASSGLDLPWTDVLDLATLQVVQHLDGNFAPSRLLDGSLAWQGTRQNPDYSYQLDLYRPNETNAMFKLTSPSAGAVTWIAIP